MSYTGISDALVFSERRPRRRIISLFIQYYSYIVGAFVTCILLVSALPYAPIWTLTWIALYWLYLFGKRWFRSHPRLGDRYASKYLQFMRSLLLILGISAFLGYLYSTTPYLEVRGGADTLWLLYLMAIFIMSQRGVTELLLPTIILASGALVSVYAVALPSGTPFPIAELSAKILWLGLLSTVLHILIRYIGDWYANVRLLHDVEHRILETPSHSEGFLLKTTVTRIAEDFDFPHVNVFYLEGDERLRLVAAACDAGAELIQQGFTLDADHGIIGHVVQTGECYVSNDVTRDEYYYEHTAFSDTLAELVVPMYQRGELLGVLDIQVQRTGFFFDQDVEVMEILVSHLGSMLATVQIHEDLLDVLRLRRQMNAIIESIAHRFLSQHALEGTLREMAEIACQELEADAVIMYEHNPFTNRIHGPFYHGGLRHDHPHQDELYNPDSLVQRLLWAEGDHYFHNDVNDILDTELFARSEYHKRSGEPTFVEREGIQSRAVLRLRTDTDCVGLMFLNYRERKNFGRKEDKFPFYMFGHLAALAIQKAQFHQQQLQVEREEMAESLHDQLIATVDGASRIVTTMLRGAPHDDRELTPKLSILRDALHDLKRDIRYLNETLKDKIVEDLPQEVTKIIERTESAYGVACTVQWTGYARRIPDAVGVHLRTILNEALLNAVRHGDANHIAIEFHVTDKAVTISLTDDGCGFDTDRIRPRGLANMKNRALRLGGTLTVDSIISEGTCVSATIPIWHAH